MAYISFQPSDYFATKLYNSTGSALTVTGVGFQPDMVWVKDRTGGGAWVNVDAVRGSTIWIGSNSNSGNVTRADQITSFDVDGWSLGVDAGNFINVSTNSNISYNWKESTTSKCDIVQYSGTGSAQTIAHNLGVKPDLILIKRTDTTSNWIMYHTSLGATKFLYFNLTTASTTNSGTFNNTEPTSSVFTVNSWNDVNNASGTYIAYVFANTTGFFRAGAYVGTGNATHGAFINTGFRPAMVIYKKSDGIDSWFIHDTKRQGYNPDNEYLFPDLPNVEGTANRINLLSNGFNLTTTDGGANGSGATYVYAAWAEFPTVSSNGKAGVAR
jgi:hypothetical protein